METMLKSPTMSRSAWGSVLVIAALAAMAGAWLLERLGLHGTGLRPLSFVGTVVAVKLGLFAFWPQLSTKGKTALHTVWRGARGPRPPQLALWNEHDPRLDVSLFSTNVPTFILNQDQRVIDYNPAFELVFGGAVRRGYHVSRWYGLLDNFRRVPKRTDKLYGEGILPITDRERATYLSKEYGRMVFTKIMAPIIDRRSGRIIGWSVVLNVNSVNKRQEFFEKLYASIASETRRARYAASYDGLYTHYAPRRRLVDLHVEPFRRAGRMLVLGCGTGSAAVALASEGHHVTAVEKDTQLLRRAKDRCEMFPGQVKLVRRDFDGEGELRDLPDARFDGCVMMLQLHRLDDPVGALAAACRSMKPGAKITVSTMLATGGVDGHFNALRQQLEADGRYDNLKHQFNHVLELEREQAMAWRLPTREDVRAMVLEAGFMIDAEHAGLEDGHTLIIVARK